MLQRTILIGIAVLLLWTCSFGLGSGLMAGKNMGKGGVTYTTTHTEILSHNFSDWSIDLLSDNAGGVASGNKASADGGGVWIVVGIAAFLAFIASGRKRGGA